MSEERTKIFGMQQYGMLEFDISQNSNPVDKEEIVHAIEVLAKFLGLELSPGGNGGGGAPRKLLAISRPRKGSFRGRIQP